MKTYEIERRNDVLRIEVPEEWKVTFGPIVVGGASRYGGSSGSLALRFYESETKQRAIFTNVLSFRDLSLKLERKVEHKSGEDLYELDSNGNRRLVQQATITSAWEPVDGNVPTEPDDEDDDYVEEVIPTASTFEL